MPDLRSILDPLQIPDSLKADAWDAYTQAKTTDELKARLDKLPLANGARADLWDAKHAEMPSGSPASAAKDTTGSVLGDVFEGIGAGVFHIPVGIYDLIRKIPGVAEHLPEPSPYLRGLTHTPDTIAGKVGRAAEGVAEFAIPVGEVSKAVEALPLVADALKAGAPLASRIAASGARIAAESATAGGVAGVQSGGDPQAMGDAALTTGLLGTAGAVVPAAAKAVISRIAPRLAGGGIPLTADTEALAQKYGVPLTTGMRTGSPAVQSIEGVLGNTVAPDLYRPALDSAKAGLNAGAKDLSGGFATDQFTAGDNTIKTMLREARDYTAQAQNEYGNLARLEADPANIREVRLGTRANPSADPNLPDRIPDVQSMGLPVDMRGTKSALAPLAEEMSRYMTGLQKTADPGLAAIQNILSRPDYLPASVAEADLGYLKGIMRGNAQPQAKRLAGAAIDALSSGVEKAVAQAGPDGLAALHDARGAWQARTDILGQLKELGVDEAGKDGQVSLAKKLLQPSDASFPALKKVLDVAPDAAGDIGKAFLTERVFQGVAKGEDLSPRQAANLWNQIGPRTKAALYTPDQIQQIDDFMGLAKRVAENPNASKDGALNTLLKVGAFVAHPVGGASSFALGRNIAKLLYSPTGADALRTALTAPGSPEASKAMLAVKAIMDERAAQSGQ